MSRALYAKVSDLWPDLCAQAGLSPDGWRGSKLSVRDDARVQRAVMLYRGRDGNLVAKRQIKPHDPAQFKDRIEAHLAAFDAMEGQGVPEILAFDLERQAVLMRHAPGAVLADVLDGADVLKQALTLRKAGEWLSAFHACQLDERRMFQPKYTLRYLQQVMGEVADGSREVAMPSKFLRWAELLVEMQGSFENRWTASCATHGDLHQRNLIVGDTGVTGIDFGNRTMAPVGHDIARLLVDHAITTAEAAPDPGEVLAAETLQGFFQGYTLVGPDDPSVRLMMRMRLMSEWIGLPADKADRRPSQARRFRALKRLIPEVMRG